MLEEEQIQEFVHCVLCDEHVRSQLQENPEEVIGRLRFSPRVARIISRLIPQLAWEQPVQLGDQWWHV